MSEKIYKSAYSLSRNGILDLATFFAAMFDVRLRHVNNELLITS